MYMYICIKVYIFFYVAKNAVVFLLDKKLLFLHAPMPYFVDNNCSKINICNGGVAEDMRD